MKKTILTLLVLALLPISPTNAGTTEEVVIKAIEATIEKARVDNSGIIVTTHQEVKLPRSSNSSKTASESATEAVIISSLSNMRAQAELYWSNYGSYGPTTQSCSQGMFADRQYGLSQLLTGLSTYTKTVNCSATLKSEASWAVTAKLANGNFWCVDSRGTSKRIAAGLSKNILDCTKGKAIPEITEKYTYDGTFSIFPKSNNNYEAVYDRLITGPKETIRTTKIVKDNTTYQYMTDKFLTVMQSEGVIKSADAVKLNKIKNSYLIIPHDQSYLSGFEALDREKIGDMLSAFYKSKFTARLIKTTLNGTSNYELTTSSQSLLTLASRIKSEVDNETTNLYRSLFNQSIKSNPVSVFSVDIQNGLIVSITSKNSNLNTYKNTVTIKKGPIFSALPNKTITCNELFTDTYGYVCSNATELRKAIAASDTIDSKLQSNMSTSRAQAELYYSLNNSYGTPTTSCSGGLFSSTEEGSLSTLMQSIIPLTVGLVCNSSAQSWMMSAKSISGNYYCVDSQGYILTQTNLKSPSDTKCN